MKMSRLFLMIMFLAISGYSQAVMYTYDFSSFSSDGDSYEGVTLDYMTLSSETNSLVYQSAYGGGIGSGPVGGNAGDVYLEFSSAINFLSVRGGDGAGDLDAFGVLLYEFGTNNFLGQVYTPGFDGPNAPEWYTLDISGYSNIGRAVLDPCNGGNCPGNAGSAGGVVFTDIAYNVPEPLSLMLLSFGLIGLGFVKRKKSAG